MILAASKASHENESSVEVAGNLRRAQGANINENVRFARNLRSFRDFLVLVRKQRRAGPGTVAVGLVSEP